jgi:hypothetical protein
MQIATLLFSLEQDLIEVTCAKPGKIILSSQEPERFPCFTPKVLGSP